MLKLKNAKNLDPRLAMLVDHAYLCVKPPAGGVGARAKQRPPEQQYVEMLLLQRLDRRTTPKVRFETRQRAGRTIPMAVQGGRVLHSYV